MLSDELMSYPCPQGGKELQKTLEPHMEILGYLAYDELQRYVDLIEALKK